MNETQEMKRWFTATMVLQGLLAGEWINDSKKGAALAVAVADSLFAELNKTKDRTHEST